MSQYHYYYYNFNQKYQRYITNEILNKLSEKKRSFKDIWVPLDNILRLSILDLKFVAVY